MFIYVIGSDAAPSKIGFSKDVTTRLKTLQTGNPSKLTIHHAEEVDPKKVRLLEKKLHHELYYKRLKGEWFDIPPSDAVKMVQYAMIRWADDPLLGI